MKKSTAIPVIAILAVLAAVLGILCMDGNRKIGTLEAETAEKAAQVSALSAEMSEKAGQIEALGAEIAEKAGRIEEMTAELEEKEKEIRALTENVKELTAAMTTPEPGEEKEQQTDYEPDARAAVNAVTAFLDYWCANDLDGMLGCCTEEWSAAEENPRTALFALLANRTPKAYELLTVSGPAGEGGVNVTANALIDRNNGKEPAYYRLEFLLKKGADGNMRVDPRSLRSGESATAPRTDASPAAAPTEAPAFIGPDTVLYYFPQGGEYYHLDPNCRKVNPKYQPLEGHFTVAELNSEEYRELQPCAVCGAPERTE